MVNPGILFLVILLIIFIISGIIIFLFVYNKNNNNNIPLNSCKSQTNISSLLPITNAQVCYSLINQVCQANGTYYLGQISQGEYDYVVTSFGSTPLDVCVNFCTESYTSSNTAPNIFGICQGDTNSQTNFNNCMNQLNSTTCIPPIPIAINPENNILYYPFTPTSANCLNSSCQQPV
jgi:hypothetical protein